MRTTSSQPCRAEENRATNAKNCLKHVLRASDLRIPMYHLQSSALPTELSKGQFSRPPVPGFTMAHRTRDRNVGVVLRMARNAAKHPALFLITRQVDGRGAAAV
ncbi:hypothetical protein ANANG_G00314300 [Anguilla anguilla]|uniref:Uncharacterized protein n=1 Tax=Anguilla anguilla TaxID=7936 RepID=A0A9D3RI09_ANGAN|nr:hypothetical protein ANANG_G00314300 [Anguilla anguilla]